VNGESSIVNEEKFFEPGWRIRMKLSLRRTLVRSVRKLARPKSERDLL